MGFPLFKGIDSMHRDDKEKEILKDDNHEEKIDIKSRI